MWLGLDGGILRERTLLSYMKIKSEASWRLIEDADAMWEGMAQCIRKLAKGVLGISKGGRGRTRGVWWWDDEVKEKIKEKQNDCAALSNSTLEEGREDREAKYKTAK